MATFNELDPHAQLLFIDDEIAELRELRSAVTARIRAVTDEEKAAQATRAATLRTIATRNPNDYTTRP